MLVLGGSGLAQVYESVLKPCERIAGKSSLSRQYLLGFQACGIRLE